MLRIYDYLEAVMEEHNNRQWYFETKLNHLASDIMEALEIEDSLEFAAAVNRAFRACDSLNIPLGNNFKKIYRFNGTAMIPDWKISPLACYLIIINCNPSHEPVAKAQLYFAMHQATK